MPGNNWTFLNEVRLSLVPGCFVGHQHQSLKYKGVKVTLVFVVLLGAFATQGEQR